MAVPASIDSLDTVPEALRGEYVAGDGSANRPDADKFYLDVESVGDLALENTKGLRNTVQTLRRELKDAKEAGKVFEGLDPDAAREAMARIESLEAEGGNAEAQVKARLDSLRKQLTDNFARDRQGFESEIQGLESELERALVDSVILSSVPEGCSPDVVLPIAKQFVRVVKDEDGKRAARCFDEHGNELVSTKAENNGNPMGVPELFASLRSNPRYAQGFNGSGPTGSGESGTGSSQAQTQNQGRHPSANQNPSRPSIMSPVERLKAARAAQSSA